MVGGKRFLTINEARATRQSAAVLYYQTQDAWKADPSNTKLADKHLKAWRDWEEAQEQYERAKRRANWKRAERLLTLAAHGRNIQDMAHDFYAGNFQVIR
jgi:hypothetical protein